MQAVDRIGRAAAGAAWMAFRPQVDRFIQANPELVEEVKVELRRAALGGRL